MFRSWLVSRNRFFVAKVVPISGFNTLTGSCGRRSWIPVILGGWSLVTRGHFPALGLHAHPGRGWSSFSSSTFYRSCQDHLSIGFNLQASNIAWNISIYYLLCPCIDGLLIQKKVSLADTLFLGGWAIGSPSVFDWTLGEGDGERDKENNPGQPWRHVGPLEVAGEEASSWRGDVQGNRKSGRWLVGMFLRGSSAKNQANVVNTCKNNHKRPIWEW